MKHPEYPGVSSFIDNRGAIRWRFRKSGMKPVYLPGEPHTKPFDDAWQAATEGRIVKKAEVIQHPHAAHPHSLNACWRLLRETAKWKKLDWESQLLYDRVIEEYLRKSGDNSMRIGDVAINQFRPRHVAAALDELADKPSMAKLLLVMLRKLTKVAIIHEWIEYDPTYGIEAPENASEGHKAWPSHLCARFEVRWPIGTTPRTAYELARWLGTRRSDVALIRWDQLVTKIIDGEAVEGFDFIQFKGRRRKGVFAKFHPITPMLAEALAPLSRSTETVLAKKNGKPYDMKSLSVMMWKTWAPEAGIPRGYSLHGLRHAMGAMLADAEATAHQSKDVLGHATMAEVDRYSKSRNQARGAVAGSRKVVKLVRG
jgi:integrase